MPLIRKDPAAATGPLPSEPRPAAEMLRTGTTHERWAAARALGGVQDGANARVGTTAQDGTNALAEALKRETEPRVRDAIFTSLVRIGKQESVDAVVPFLRGDDANLRMGALDALRAMIGAAREVLPQLLSDPDADIRLLSCDLVRDLPSSEATRLLCDLLINESEPNVCAAAVDVLADVGDRNALPILEHCASRFGDATFLAFAVKIAMERIMSDRPANHG
jgi:HEAT repeat protein